MSQLHMKFIFSCSLLLLFFNLQAQQTPSGQKAWESAQKAFKKENYEKTIEECREIFAAEPDSQISIEQSAFLVKAYRLMGSAFEKNGRKDSAIKFINIGIAYSRAIQDTMQAVEMVMEVNRLYHLCRTDTGDIWLQKLMGYPKTMSKFLMFKTKYLDTTRYDWREGDTCWFTCTGGLNDGIYSDAVCGFYSIYKPSYRPRPVIYLGEGKITISYAQSSYGYFVFNKDFFDTIYVRDGVYVDCGIPESKNESDVFDCAIAGFTSSTPDSKSYYIYPTSSLYYPEPFFTQGIYKKMLEELHTKAQLPGNYHGYESGMTLNSGRFAGMTLQEALAQSTIYDVEHFVNIPATYTSTYYNYDQEFCYEYIYWITHEGYTGSNQHVLWKMIQEIPESKIEIESKKYAFYYNYWPLLDSFITNWIDTMEIHSLKMESSRKCLAFANNSGVQSRKSHWLEKLCIDAFSNTDFSLSNEYANQWKSVATNTVYPLLFGGVSARFKKDYKQANDWLDSVLNIESEILNSFSKDSAEWVIKNAQAYKAWCLLVSQKNKEALELISKSFKTDSNNRSTRSIYAYTLAMLGSYSEASRHMDSTLELLWSPHHFFQIQWCFDELKAIPGAPDWVFTEYNRIKNKYENQYFHSIIMDSMLARAATFYEQDGKKPAALLQYQSALIYSQKYLAKDSANLIFILDWLGYIAIEEGKDSLALIYYKLALEVCQKFHFNSEKILFELDNIIYTANLLGYTEDYRIYSKKRRELNETISSRKLKKLFIFSCGSNESTQTSIKELYAENDAITINNTLEDKGKLFYDDVITVSLTGAQLTLDSLNSTFDTLAEKVGENDAFVFYYSGPTRDDNSYIQLNLADDYLLAGELGYALSNIKCQKKVVLIDGGNLPIDSLYKAILRYDPDFKNQSNLLMGIRDWRQESTPKKHGDFTQSLINCLEMESEVRSISTTGLINNVYQNLKEIGSSMAVVSIFQGYDIVLGLRPQFSNKKDTSFPVIELYNAKKITLRGDNIPVRSTEESEFIRGEISDPAGIMVAFINEMELKIQPNGRFSYPKNKLKSDTFIIRAYNKNNFMDSVVAILEKSVATSIQNKKLAFLFANEKYDTPYWGELTNTVVDANAIGEILHNYYGYKIEIIPSTSSNEMMKKLLNIKKIPFNKGDQLLLFFAGHGYYSEDLGFKVVCKDSENPDSGILKNYISGSDLIYHLDDIKCDNKFLIMDACYAGSMAKKDKYEPYAMVSSSKTVDEFVNRQKEIKVFQFYFSSRTNPVEEGVRGAHSPFALQLIDNLTFAARNLEYVNLNFLRTNEAQFGSRPETMPVAGYWSRSENGEYIIKRTQAMRNTDGIVAGNEKPDGK